MCGIVGGVYSVNRESVKKYVDSLIHRGPDSQGIYQEDSVFLGHTRLAIQDLSENGNQPMFSLDGRYVIVFNGEIYNHLEIRSLLLNKYQFRSSGDTETILNAYIEYGTAFLDMLNGIFALAIFDTKEKIIFIARDHFGVKPLYYYKDQSKFLFSSEIKTMIEADICKEIDSSALVDYLTFLWSPGGKTPFLKVRKLLPGHYMKFSINDYQESYPIKFYKPDFNGIYSKKSELELIDELDQRLTNAVKRQMLSDVPVGFFLSGGLDSTLLVAIAKKMYPEIKFSCFTIDVDNAEEKLDGFVNDIDFAKKAAAFLDVELHIVKGQVDILTNFNRMIWHLDEPQADPAPLHVFNIATLSRQLGIKVLVGGTAGDDIFSGYRRHQALNYEKYFNLIPKSIRKLIKYVVHSIPFDTTLVRRIKKITINLDLSTRERMKGYFQWLDTDKTKSLFSAEIAAKIGHYDPTIYFDELLLEIPEESNLLNQMLFWELNTFLVDHNLNYTDKMAMAIGVEARVPYLDRELVSFSQTLPPELKMKGTTTKYLLKKVAERYLPHDIIYRPKTGFGAPIRKWIISDMKNFVDESLSEKKIKEGGVFNYEMIKKLIEENRTGRIDAAYTIWAILSINSWLNQFAKEQ